MPKSKLDELIQSRVDTFTKELSLLVRQAAVEAVKESLSTDGLDAPSRKRRKGKRPIGRPRKKKAGTRAPKKQVRRTAADLEALAAKVFAYVKKNKGQGVEGLAAGLGIPSAELKKPILDLLAAGRLRKEGEKRGTKYFTKGK